MPVLKIQTNVDIKPQAQTELMSKLSETVTEQLEKSERYVMIIIEASTPMLYAGDEDPSAYLELKSIGLPESKTTQYSEALCAVITETLKIKGDRIYIEFSNAERHLWGWNSRTF